MRPHALLAFVVAGCASGAAAGGDTAATDILKTTIAPGETIDLTRQTTIHAEEFAATRDQVWNALVAAQQRLGMQVQSADENAGVLVYYLQGDAPRVAGRPAATWVDCGRGPSGAPRASTYRITFRLTAVVEGAAEKRTRLRTGLVASAHDRGVSANELPCNSTGALERHVLALVGAGLTP